MTWPAHPKICWDEPSEDNCYEFHDMKCKGYSGKLCVFLIQTRLRWEEDPIYGLPIGGWDKLKERALNESLGEKI